MDCVLLILFTVTLGIPLYYGLYPLISKKKEAKMQEDRREYSKRNPIDKNGDWMLGDIPDDIPHSHMAYLAFLMARWNGIGFTQEDFEEYMKRRGIEKYFIKV